MEFLLSVFFLVHNLRISTHLVYCSWNYPILFCLFLRFHFVYLIHRYWDPFSLIHYSCDSFVKVHCLRNCFLLTYCSYNSLCLIRYSWDTFWSDSLLMELPSVRSSGYELHFCLTHCREKLPFSCPTVSEILFDLSHLVQAIIDADKRVWVSAFFRRPKQLQNLPWLLACAKR